MVTVLAIDLARTGGHAFPDSALLLLSQWCYIVYSYVHAYNNAGELKRNRFDKRFIQAFLHKRIEFLSFIIQPNNEFALSILNRFSRCVAN